MDSSAEVLDVVRPVGDTLRLVVLLYRVLAAFWSIVLILVVVIDGQPGDRGILAAAAILGVAWAAYTVWAANQGLMARTAFVIADGVVVSLISFAGHIAGTADFISGGYPGSWLFVVAYAASLRWTVVASLALVVEHTIIHLLMDLGLSRTVGTLQFIVLALTVGWAFDALRERERLRILAEDRLAAQQRLAVRLEEGTRLARTLHDSVLQTLKAIHSECDDPTQVRYLARWQERELRRTIEQLRSEHPAGFRVGVLAARDAVEELYRGVTVSAVIRNDAEMSPPLQTALAAASEALTNAAKHSGADHIDLYAEVSDSAAVVRIRDRGGGFDAGQAWGRGTVTSMVEPVRAAGGTVAIASQPGAGTEVTIRVPR